jgi:hypothetical protein
VRKIWTGARSIQKDATALSAPSRLFTTESSVDGIAMRALQEPPRLVRSSIMYGVLCSGDISVISEKL